MRYSFKECREERECLRDKGYNYGYLKIVLDLTILCI